MSQPLPAHASTISCLELRISVVMEEDVIMPGKEWVIGRADESKRQCREQLQQKIDEAVQELLQAGLESYNIAETLLELADDYLDTLTGAIGMDSPSTLLH